MYTAPGTFYARGVFSCANDYLDFINFRVGANIHLSQDSNREVDGNDHALSPDISVGKRGIVMATYDEILFSTYAVIRQIRRTGCKLPIELWSRSSELQSVPGAILQDLVDNYSVVLLKTEDPNVTGFFVKIYALMHSDFDEVLFLDSDNVPVRDPTYLFDTQEFLEHGAMFWPDFWHPRHSIFDTGAGGLAWELFGVQFEDEVEQESGQLLLHRKRCYRSLSLALYYAQNFGIVEKLRAVWGDKDLFRLSFKRTNSSYYMIPTLPGIAGRTFTTRLPLHKIRDGSQFCGQTMVQFDTQGEVVFLHRNTAKLHTAGGRIPLWRGIFQYTGTDRANYTVLMGPKRLPDTCWYLPFDESKRESSNSSVRYELVSYSRVEEQLIEDVERLDDTYTYWHAKKIGLQRYWLELWLRLQFSSE